MTTYDCYDILKQWKEESKISAPMMFKALDEWDNKTNYFKLRKVQICTPLPGFYIGLHGELYNKYKKLLDNCEIEFIKTDKRVL